MPVPSFKLFVDPDASAESVRFRLLDADGVQVGAHRVVSAEHAASFWEGLFDTRMHVARYAGSTTFTDVPATAGDLLARLGVFLGREVLGQEILGHLAEGRRQRTLLVRLPETQGDAAHGALVAALARVPWEIARPSIAGKSLAERNLTLRIATADLDEGVRAPEPLEDDEELRVLLVYAEAPGSRPLAMRLEREMLDELFHEKIMARRRVRIDVLCHGVTRARLREQVTEVGGYHVVHWSGHGHHDLLELRGADGGRDRLSGEGLVGLFDDAGGFIPDLVFLSACLSGTLTEARDWPSLRAAARGEATRREPDADVDTDVDTDVEQLARKHPGYTGTALALLRAGVPQVVAMRYEVGDAYARDLAHAFYTHLLADEKPKKPAEALMLARKDVRRADAAEHGAIDHATPLLLGRDLEALAPPPGRGAGLAKRRPRPQPLLTGGSRELDRPEIFVGRGRELTELFESWLERGRPAMAVVQGLAGLGKTSLAAEAIHLRHRHFDGVFAFQGKPTALRLDDFLRRLDDALALHSSVYHQLCEQQPNRRVYLPPRDGLTGEARYARLRDNLLEVLRDEALLLVLDNFETHLESDGHTCTDPQWDRLLEHLADGLPGTCSRLILTTRHHPAVLASEERALTLSLGPLPPGEAMLYVQSNPALRKLAFGSNAGWRLTQRLLEISRGHPLILSRLGALAGEPEALEQALDTLATGGFERLPDLFAERLTGEAARAERAYLEDVAMRSVDLLIARLPEEARRLLWVVTRASEPVPEMLLASIWGDDAAPLDALLEALRRTGLLTAEVGSVGFHELVKERVTAWAAEHAETRGGRTDEEVFLAYGALYKAVFYALRSSGEAGAMDRAAEAGRRGLSYLVRARAFGELGGFASQLVTGTRNPAILRAVRAELEAVADEVPEGRERWVLRVNLADAWDRVGRPDAALELYAQAAGEAEAAEHWGDVGWICQNWANALGSVGELDAARSTYRRSADAKRRAGAPRVNVLMAEFEALRLDVMQGGAEQALPEIDSGLDAVRGWFRRLRGGETVPEAPDPSLLGRVLVSALDVARQANLALERWQPCLDLLEEFEEAMRLLGEGEHELARVRFNQYGPLLRLGRLDAAQALLEGCLESFRRADDQIAQAGTLSALADLWDERGDHDQAAALQRRTLAFRDRLPDLVDRAISHDRLSNYLDRPGESLEAARHLLAAIGYLVLIQHGQHLAQLQRNLANRIHRAAADGRRYELPRLVDLLAQAPFAALRDTLAARGVEVAVLQERVDALVEQVRGGVEGEGGGG